jgi:uncharacterized protein DUF3857/transglutaminase superfamily protein
MRVCLLLGTLLAGASILCAADKAPSWLTELATREAPDYDSDISSVTLLKERRITVSSDLKVLTAERGAIRILNRQGKSEAAARVLYRTDTGKVRELRAWLVYPSGSVKEYSKKDSVDVALADNDIYNESRVRAILASGSADPGAVFGYESVEEDRSIFTQFSYQFQGELPVLTSRFSLTLPAGWKAESVTFNHEAVEPEVTGSTYTWQLQNLEPVEHEVGRQPITSLTPRVVVSYYAPGADTGPSFRSWADVSTWFAALREPQSVADQAVRTKVEELTGHAETDFERIRAVGEYAQDIRYVSIQTGIGRGGGYRPHAVGEILEKGYGDCKDKANIMCTMLEEVGIDAYPVAVYSGDRHYVRREWPSPQQFNHVIVVVRLKEPAEFPAVSQSETLGALLYFDPTDEHTPLGYLPEYLEGSLGVIVKNEAGDLVSLPVSRPEQNRLTRTVQVQMNAAGDIEAQVVELCSGEAGAANRRLFESLSTPDYRRVIERWVTRGARGAAVGTIDVSERESSDLELAVSYNAKRYAQSMQGRLLMFRPTLLSRREDLVFEDTERKYPTVLNSNSYVETTTYELPAGFAVDEFPPAVELDTDFGSYKAQAEVVEGKLVFTREMEVESSIVPAEDYQSILEFFGKIQGVENTPVVLVRN